MHRALLYTALLTFPGILAAGETVAVDRAKLMACLSIAGMKDRLVCYKEAIGRIPPSWTTLPKESLDSCLERTSMNEELACFDILFDYPRPDRPAR